MYPTKDPDSQQQRQQPYDDKDDDKGPSTRHLYTPVRRRGSGSLGLKPPPPTSNDNGSGRLLSIQSLLNSAPASSSYSEPEEEPNGHAAPSSSRAIGGQTGDNYRQQPTGRNGGMMLSADIAGNYMAHHPHNRQIGYMASDSHGSVSAASSSGSPSGRWTTTIGLSPSTAVDKLTHPSYHRYNRVYAEPTTAVNPSHFLVIPPPHNTPGHIGYQPTQQRSVSFQGPPPPPAIVRNDQRIARTAYESPTEAARYRPYPEITQATDPVAESLPLPMGKRLGDGRRKRRTQACEYCHLKKIKCEGDGERCTNCVKNDVQCAWGQKRKRGPKPKASLPTLTQEAPPPTVADDSDGGDACVSQSPCSEERGGLRAPRMEADMRAFFADVDAETREAVRFYFDYFYPLCPMFHPSMFIRRIVQGAVDPLLIDAMKAASAGVITRVTGRPIDGAALARAVKQRILEKLEQPDVDLVRVLVIMTLLAGSQGEMMAYNSLICLAASLVVRLGWHKMDLYRRLPPTSWDEWVELEVRRRVFWLVYQTDSYQAMLTGRPMSIAEDSVFVSAPCSDYEWDVVTAVIPPTQPPAQPLMRTTPPVTSRNRRSSRSSSASSSAVQSLRVDQTAIVATGAFSYSFMALCELTAIIARMNTFLCDAKSGRLTAGDLRDGPFPAVDFLGPAPPTGSLVHPVMRTVALLSEYPAFVDLDERLEEWKRNLLLPEDLRDDATAAADITYFGNADHRRFMMRVRYFCLHCYYVPITLFLHQSNRPSFFSEYEHSLDERLAMRPTPPEDEEAMADATLRQMLSMAFASTWNEGLLAYDVDDRSWRVCLLAAHGLSEHLERNADFPLERFDQVIPFCIFMSVSVLIRQVRMCSRLLEAAAASSTAQNGTRHAAAEARRQLAAKGGYMSVTADRTRCIRHVRQQWETLKKLGSLWNIDGMEALLKSMHIDQVANAADMFSTMSL